MIPRLGKRFASSKATPRKGRKGHLYGAQIKHPDVTPEENVRITRRRMQKAERDERMDITLALTPVKTYMGGFTRPRDLRSSNWFPGGRYAALGKVYESPPAAAYEPHTVFLLESRHPVRHGLGRVDAHDHVVGVCREGDLEAVLRKYNSASAPRDELYAMDNARWPWGPQYRIKRTKWWVDGEKPSAAAEAGADEDMYESEEAPEPDNVAESTADTGLEIAEARLKAIDEDEFKPQRDAKTPCLYSTPDLASEIIQTPTTLQDQDQEKEANTNPGDEKAKTTSEQHGSEPKTRGLHTAAVNDVTPRLPPPHLSEQKVPHMSAQDVREKYMPTLGSTPFWRPLLTITVSTRPLAMTLCRLSRAHPKGLPFYASITSDDRKCHMSFSARMRCMRIARMKSLAVDMAQLLSGVRGGFVGIRFDVNERGRSIGGEGLEKPVEWEKRVIKVGVGNWYVLQEEVKEGILDEGKNVEGVHLSGVEDKGAFEVWGLDEHGRRMSESGEVVAWRKSAVVTDFDFEDLEAMVEEETLEGMSDIEKRKKAKLVKQKIAREHGREIALSLAQRHRSVVLP